MRKLVIVALLAAGLATQGSAQSGTSMVGAHSPDSVVIALKNAGYKAELGTDDSGDPKITTDFSGMVSYIYFYGCYEAKECTSLMFVTGFGRKNPWEAKDAIKINEDVRFASSWLEDEGDPWISWDVVTGQEGVPMGTFSYGLRQYEDTVDRVADMVFEDEE